MIEGMPIILFMSTLDEWHSNITYFLMYGEYRDHLSYKDKMMLKLKDANYVLWDNGLYKKSIDGTFEVCR